MVMKHTEDGGDLSLFASEDQLLVTCSNGHYWLLKASQHTMPKDEARPKALSTDGSRFRILADRFGEESMRHLRRDLT